MEGLGMTCDFWKGKRVLITGHTGFKGGWLSLVLQNLGARVAGFAREPDTDPNLFNVARVGDGMTSVIGDLREPDAIRALLQEHAPEVVFHMAAQSLVRRSYAEPIETYATNVMGTVHLLEAVRATPGVRAVVNVTSDKCYENREWVWGYRESDRLGGHDPYSNSKGCAELVTSAYRQSFFHQDHCEEHGVALASARAGNVIGGGDWAKDRLVPDIVRAFTRDEPTFIRSPESIRPWQHVIEPLRGYLMLAERLHDNGPVWAESWNFGPDETDARSVRDVTERMRELWGNGKAEYSEATPELPEARFLKLDCSKARARLGWSPRWDLDRGLEATVEWYRRHAAGEDMRGFTEDQLRSYLRDD